MEDDSADASGETLNRVEEWAKTAGEGVTSGRRTCEIEPKPPGESIALRQGLGGMSMSALRAGEVGPENGAGISVIMRSASPSPRVREASLVSCSQVRIDFREFAVPFICCLGTRNEACGRRRFCVCSVGWRRDLSAFEADDLSLVGVISRDVLRFSFGMIRGMAGVGAARFGLTAGANRSSTSSSSLSSLVPSETCDRLPV